MFFHSYVGDGLNYGAKEDMQFMTVLHMGTDIHCLDCSEVLG
jgi:hypothetical protein